MKEHLDEEPLPLLEQAEGYRARLKTKELKSGAEVATDRTAEVIKQDVPQVLEEQFDTPPENSDPPPTFPAITILSQRVIDIEINGCQWQITLELSDDPSIGDWVDLCEQFTIDGDVRKVGIRLALAHPFMERFGGTESTRIEPLLRVAVAIVLAEITARSSGVRQAGAIRRNINDLLRTALSKP